jgi:hypothetical protein
MMEEVNLSMIYLIYCKNFCKCHNVPPPNTTIKKRLKIQLKKRKYIFDKGDQEHTKGKGQFLQ